VTATLVAIFALVDPGMILGGLPFLQLDRTDLARHALCRQDPTSYFSWMAKVSQSLRFVRVVVRSPPPPNSAVT